MAAATPGSCQPQNSVKTFCPEGGTPAELLDRAFCKVLTVPKDAVLKADERERMEREKKREARKKPPVLRGGNGYIFQGKSDLRHACALVLCNDKIIIGWRSSILAGDR